MGIWYFVLMYVSAIIAGILGGYCDTYKKMKAPQLYWSIGMIGGCFTGAFMVLAILAVTQ